MADINLASTAFNIPQPNIGRRVIYPLPKNPADKSTIVSVFPKEIDETKTTIFPQRYVIPAAAENDFSILVLNGASYYTPAAMDRMPPTEIQINAAQLAGSICNDYIQAIPLASNDRKPGIFWIPGEYTKITILKYSDGNKTFGQLLEQAREQQKRWFTAVLEEADVLWSRTNGNPRSISDYAKLAAELMGVASQKPWMNNTVAATLDKCPACGELINSQYPVCKHCHAVINKKRAEELGLTFSKG